MEEENRKSSVELEMERYLEEEFKCNQAFRLEGLHGEAAGRDGEGGVGDRGDRVEDSGGGLEEAGDIVGGTQGSAGHVYEEQESGPIDLSLPKVCKIA